MVNQCRSQDLRFTSWLRCQNMSEMNKNQYVLKKYISWTLICVSVNITAQEQLGNFPLKYIFLAKISYCKIYNFILRKSHVNQKDPPARGVLCKFVRMYHQNQANQGICPAGKRGANASSCQQRHSRTLHTFIIEITGNEILCVVIHSQRKRDLARPDQFTTMENVKTWILDNFDWPFLFNPWHILVLWLKMFIWFSLKRETEKFYWFSSRYKSQFLQTLIPVDALYEHSKKGGAWRKEGNSPSEIIPVSKPTFTGNHLQYSPSLLIMWDKVTPMADTTKSWITKEQLHFQLSNEACRE